MANALYDKAREHALDDGMGLVAGNVKVVLLDLTQYTFSAAHEFLSDIPVGARIATSGNLANKTVTAGVFDADDVTFVALTGADVGALAIYVDTGDAATSPLIEYKDQGTFPYTPSGGDAVFRWSNDANKIFKV